MAKKTKPLPVAWMKVYDRDSNYVSSCVSYHAAAALMAFYGDGAQVRNGHTRKRVIWSEGKEAISASGHLESVVNIMTARVTPEPVEMTPAMIESDRRLVEDMQKTKAIVRAMLAKNGSDLT